MGPESWNEPLSKQHQSGPLGNFFGRTEMAELLRLTQHETSDPLSYDASLNHWMEVKIIPIYIKIICEKAFQHRSLKMGSNPIRSDLKKFKEICWVCHGVEFSIKWNELPRFPTVINIKCFRHTLNIHILTVKIICYKILKLTEVELFNVSMPTAVSERRLTSPTRRCWRRPTSCPSRARTSAPPGRRCLSSMGSRTMVIGCGFRTWRGSF